MNSSTSFSSDIYDDLNESNINKKSDLPNSNSNNNNDLEIEEQTLSLQLNENKAQLSFINEQLSLDSENEEFLLIKTSLEELVQLLEGELLTIKKRKLLAQLDRTQYVDEFRVLADSSTSSYSGSGSSKVDLNGSQDSLITIDDDDDDETESIQNLVQQFNGQECSVPFRFSNGQVAYHDAILKVDDEIDDSLEDLRLKAFFLYPITESMLTCPFYLKNKCKFSTENTVTCKYSHGIAISLDQIKPKQSYSIEDHQHERNSNSELTCLVRNASVKLKVQTRDNRNLWSKALVVRTDEVKGQILVRLRKDQTDHWVKLDEHDLVMVDHEEEEGPDESETSDLKPQEIVPELTNSTNILNPPEFGEWERYTNGIGSKLMAKMGYQLGKGLGSGGQGILNPIETVVYPTGKSLDTCFALKTESDNRKTDFKYILKEKARKLRLEAKRAKQYEQADKRLRQNGSVFKFLDDMFYGTSNSISNPNPNPIPQTPNLTKKQTRMKQLDSKSLNLSAFQVDEELRKAEQELAKIEGSYRRNANSSKADRSVVKHLEDKMNKHRRKVEELRRKQKTIGREKSHRQNKDKLTVF